jgi:type II secretory pathway component PulJ
VRGYTFVELIISSVIFAILTLSVFSAFYAGIFGNRNIAESMKLSQTAAQVLEWMDADLRNSVVYSKEAANFEGDPSSLRFLSVSGTFRGGTLHRDYSSIAYKLDGAKLLRQCRLNGAALNTAVDNGFEEMAGNVMEVVFRYGKMREAGADLDWQPDWREPASMPAAVGIRLVLKEKNSAEFERIIYLPSQ